MLRSWLLFLAALAGGAALAVLYDPNIGFAILYGAGLYLVLSFLSILAVKGSIRVEESADADSVFKGERLTYTLAVRNRGIFFYPRIHYTFYNPELEHFDSRNVPVGAGEPLRSVVREYRIRFPYRGVFRLGVESMVVTDLFGLFRRKLRGGEPIVVTALPTSDERFGLGIRDEPQYVARRTFHEDYTTVSDIRRYDTADSLRKVHWKLSAKRGELMVKNYHTVDRGRTVLYLDTVKLPLERREAAEFEDRMVGCVAAAADYCVQGNLPTDLVYGEAGVDQAPVAQGEELGLYVLLAGISFDRERSPIAALERAESGSSILAFLSRIDESVFEALKERISFDHDVTLYYLSSNTLPLTPEADLLLEGLEACGVGVHRVNLDAFEDEGEAIL